MSATSVAKIYKSVIEDVISGVKDAFLDEGVDEQVLTELKQIWEKKLHESKAIEPVEPPAPVVKVTQQSKNDSQVHNPIAPPTIHIQRNPPNAHLTNAPITIGPNGQVIQTSNAPQIVHYGTGGAGPTAIRLPSQNPTPLTLPPEVAASLVQTTNGTLSVEQVRAIQAAMLRQQQMKSGQAQFTITVPVPGSQPNVVAHPAPLQVQVTRTPSAPTITAQVPGVTHLQTTTGQSSAQGQQTGPTITQVRVIKMPGQVDGAALDSSSDDDSSDDDALDGDGVDGERRRVGKGKDDDDDLDDLEDEEDEANDEIDEEPLNSDDDVSDEEASEIQEIDNVVVCQYDKISRSRNRWKFHLKDGIMNIQGRDYVFQKSVGDAEW